MSGCLSSLSFHLALGFWLVDSPQLQPHIHCFLGRAGNPEQAPTAAVTMATDRGLQAAREHRSTKWWSRLEAGKGLWDGDKARRDSFFHLAARQDTFPGSSLLSKEGVRDPFFKNEFWVAPVCNSSQKELGKSFPFCELLASKAK